MCCLSHKFSMEVEAKRADTDQASRVAALAMKRGKSVDFTGYGQRHIEAANRTP